MTRRFTHYFHELSRGSNSLWVLAVLRDGPLHGYAIAREMERRTDCLIQIREGTLYPLLRELEEGGLLVGEWVPLGNRQRRVYSLTDSGRAELEGKVQVWREFSDAMNRVTGPRPD
jgi:PadR family transcriptional regulator PadR